MWHSGQMPSLGEPRRSTPLIQFSKPKINVHWTICSLVSGEFFQKTPSPPLACSMYACLAAFNFKNSNG